MVVTAVYDDGTKEVVEEYKWESEKNNSTLGTDDTKIIIFFLLLWQNKHKK